jgi:uncharacterized RDD family membrane protein YckC
MSISVGSPSFDAAPSFGEEATRVSGRRFLAHFVDGLLYSFAALAALIPFFVLAAFVDSPVTMVLYVVAIVAILTVGHIWFLVLLHRGDGRSPGKKAAGIRVVDAQGQVPSNAALWKRFTPVIIEYLYVIAWAGMMASPYRQRFGDRWADTYVIRD